MPTSKCVAGSPCPILKRLFLRREAFFVSTNTNQTGGSMEQEAYRVLEFCQRYAISKASFYRETAANRLRIIKRGRTTLVTRLEAQRWFDTLCQNQPQQSA